jgi:hypothetical protein
LAHGNSSCVRILVGPPCTDSQHPIACTIYVSFDQLVVASLNDRHHFGGWLQVQTLCSCPSSATRNPHTGAVLSILVKGLYRIADAWRGSDTDSTQQPPSSPTSAVVVQGCIVIKASGRCGCACGCAASQYQAGEYLCAPNGTQMCVRVENVQGWWLWLR